MSVRRLLPIAWAGLALACSEASPAREPAADTDQPETDASSVGPDQVATRFVPLAGELPNPDRGFYAFVDELATLSADDLDAEYAGGVRLVYTPVRLDAFVATPIDQATLDGFEQGLERIRAAGLGLILRFTYNYPEDEQGYLDAKDAGRGQVESHIAQLAPLVARNRDVIAYWQAGFIGAWGEWHTSSNGLDSVANKDAVRDALLAALPADIYLQFRYPPDLARWLPDAQSIAQTRFGLHNDCFLSSPDDVGTFEQGLDDPLRAFAAALTAVAPFGGETCDAEAPSQQRRECAAVLAEGARYHLTYLNRDYHTAFHDGWRRDGCFDEVRDRMGYRLVLVEAHHLARAAQAATFSLGLTLDNVGWARAYGGHALHVTLAAHDRPDVTVVLSSGIAAHALVPGAHALTLNVALPATVTPGRYRVGVSLPHPTLADRRRAIRFANEDRPEAGQIWIADHFEIGTTLIVY